MRRNIIVFILLLLGVPVSELLHAQDFNWVQNQQVQRMMRKHYDDSIHYDYTRAMNYWKSGDIRKGIAFLKKASIRGHSFAKLHLANIYRQGLGVEKDLKQSFSYYQELHEQGEPIGSYNAAIYLENGWGVEKDVSKAFDYYERAATRQKYAEAQRALGSMYFSGRG